MKVYKYTTDSDAYSVPFDWDDDDVNSDYLDEIVETYFDGRARASKYWDPPFFGILDPRKKVADLGFLVSDGVLVFSQKAVDALQPLLGTEVELLPYSTEVGTYYLVNVLDEGEYLDRVHTDCDRIMPDGRCAGINRYAFHANRLRGKHIFRISDKLTSRFISGEFVEACRQHQLTGIDLTEESKVWESTTS
ncbi:imm11 family protein [Hymenobacter fodinae]|uniref:Immunity MXAN-0049 protein domain-containing protein n=1 Tax=Hymenobacter fodinae TaxID=2510796 RepID=A0A4Z0P8R2_9BACT|nr:DUF1629 domain-containing protein [Hymenobacter fodinae]TGE07766.1 hypothetical protein EU556_08405 [Hymenobacter fodinae]